jgi:sulfopyruvate decarboxylase subunit alpha
MSNLVAADRAKAIVGHLKRAGIDLVTALPDVWLCDVIGAVDEDPAMTLIRVTREDEGVGICGGAFLGGRKAALVAQNAGVLSSANALAGLAMHHQIPILLLVAQRGGADDNQYYQVYKGRVTVPVLDAIGLPYRVIDRAEDFYLIEEASRQSYLARMPVALLFSRRALQGEEA